MVASAKTLIRAHRAGKLSFEELADELAAFAPQQFDTSDPDWWVQPAQARTWDEVEEAYDEGLLSDDEMAAIEERAFRG